MEVLGAPFVWIFGLWPQFLTQSSWIHWNVLHYWNVSGWALGWLPHGGWSPKRPGRDEKLRTFSPIPHPLERAEGLEIKIVTDHAALAHVVGMLDRIHRKTVGSIPGEGTCLGCGLVYSWSTFLSLSFPSSSFLSKIDQAWSILTWSGLHDEDPIHKHSLTKGFGELQVSEFTQVPGGQWTPTPLGQTVLWHVWTLSCTSCPLLYNKGICSSPRYVHSVKTKEDAFSGWNIIQP